MLLYLYYVFISFIYMMNSWMLEYVKYFKHLQGKDKWPNIRKKEGRVTDIVPSLFREKESQ